MLSVLHSSLRKPVLVAADFAVHPLEAWTRIQDTLADRRERRGPQHQYQTDQDWEHWIHDQLGVEWPCKLTAEFWTLWPEVMRELEAKGIQPGPESFKYWNDGDAGLARSIWCLIRHLRPNNVVETGVGHGVTSRIVLEAMERNGRGHLSSIDLPTLEKGWQEQVGIAVSERLKSDGLTSRVRAGCAFLSCFPGSVRLICSFTTACIVSATFASNWIGFGRS